MSNYCRLTPEAFKTEISKNGLSCSSMIFEYDRFKKDIDGIIKEAKLFGQNM